MGRTMVVLLQNKLPEHALCFASFYQDMIQPTHYPGKNVKMGKQWQIGKQQKGKHTYVERQAK